MNKQRNIWPFVFLFPLVLAIAAAYLKPAEAAGIGGGSGISAPPVDVSTLSLDDGVSCTDLAVTFAADTNSGFYRAGTDDWRFCVGGDQHLQLNEATSTIQIGSSPTDEQIDIFGNLQAYGDTVLGNGTGDTVQIIVSASNTSAVFNNTNTTFDDVPVVIGTGSSLSVGGGAAFDAVLTATAVKDFASISTEQQASQDITVTGAAVGDPCMVGASAVQAAVVYTCRVQSADTVRVYAHNNGATSADPDSQTLRVVVFSF